MVSFEHARRLAWAYCEPRFSGLGTFTVAPWGYEDATHYLMVVGAAESVIECNADYLMLDDVAVFVDKVTGEVAERFMLESFAVVDAMRLVGVKIPAPAL